jgi:nucleotide-binding universal stress UspA family protein
MYNKILVALDHSAADKNLWPHVSELARIHHSHLLLVHVAEGWAARYYNEFNLKESEEMIQDRIYLEEMAQKLKSEGLSVNAVLALGEPAAEILNLAKKEGCDLIAMSSHGHRLLGDLFFGSAIEEVRHQSNIPMLIVSSF